MFCYRAFAIALFCLALGLVFGNAAVADDGPTSTPPRAAPVARGFITANYAPSFTALVDQAIAAASDLTTAAQRARAVADAQKDVAAEAAEVRSDAAHVGAIPDRLERLARIASTRAVSMASLTDEERGVVAGAIQLGTDRTIRSDALAAEQAALMRSGIWSLPSADAHWVMPVQGEITQPFGPTSLRLEPPRTLNGVTYAHFHDGLDISAPLYAPVVAAAPGEVIFVGHIADGAEIVLIAHIGGYVSEYGHLADGVAAPTVHAGDFVRAGDVIGRVGLTGLTTGAHLHFEAWHGGVLTDPLPFMGR